MTLKLVKQEKNDLEQVESLLDKAFGRDRFEKASYRVRENVEPTNELSFVFKDGDKVVATIRYWPIYIKSLSGELISSLILGPLAVDSDYRSLGLGLKLMEHSLDKARELGHNSVILVGDEPYYQKMGFSRKNAEFVTLEGQVEQHRLLALLFDEEGTAPLKGEIIAKKI